MPQEQTVDRLAAYRLHMNGPITNRHDLQAAAIADAIGAAGANPTQAEYADLVAKFNALLAAVRSGTGVGIVAAS